MFCFNEMPKNGILGQVNEKYKTLEEVCRDLLAMND